MFLRKKKKEQVLAHAPSDTSPGAFAIDGPNVQRSAGVAAAPSSETVPSSAQDPTRQYLEGLAPLSHVFVEDKAMFHS
jgi:hypothetical protein